MKFTLSWLRDHLETECSLTEICDALTMIGLEVDGVEDRAKGLEGFVVGHVLEAERHPDADKLQLCTVDVGGGETFRVVCGAPNARAGLKGVFAREGQYVPGIDFTLKKAKIRGVESCGMLLSEREMGLSDEHAGIVELPDNAAIGAKAVDIMGLGDPIIEIAITPNRGDCLGVRGVARDLASAGFGTLKPLDTAPVEGGFASPKTVHLGFDADAGDACPYFVGRMIKGVKNGPSPKWMQDRLTAIGLRPISALVDITNYVTYDLCRPLHVFDADKVTGDVHVRLAKEGETLLALDGKEYELDAGMTVIADEAKAEALAGVMGGEESGCTESTTTVFLETAYFDPVRTATTGRKLNLQSDARYRFERGVDPAFLMDATEIATKLIQNLCGGEASEVVVAGAEPDWRRTIAFRPDRVRTLAGVEVTKEKCVEILETLGFQVTDRGETLDTVAPSWRYDIVGEACLVEEVIRLLGYDKVPAVPFTRPANLPEPALTPEIRRRSLARRALAGRGLVEAVTYSFLPAAQAELFGGGGEELKLVNPISSDLDVMRPSLLPNLIAAAGRNADRGFKDAALFEVGPQFAGDAPEDQAMVAGGIRSGRTGHRNWAEAPRAVDVFDAKADALAVLAALGGPVDKLQVTAEAPDYYHPGRSGSLRLGPKNLLATFGEIHPRVLDAMGVAGPVTAFEVFVDHLPQPKKGKKGAARPHLTLSAFQPVERDFAFVVDAGIAADAVIRAARNADKGLISEVRVFDQFEGGKLAEEGKKSLAINVVLQPVEATLTDSDIEAVADKVVKGVEKATGGSLRG